MNRSTDFHVHVGRGTPGNEYYDLIRRANNIYEVCRVVNYCPQDIGYDGYDDSRFFRVRY